MKITKKELKKLILEAVIKPGFDIELDDVSYSNLEDIMYRDTEQAGEISRSLGNDNFVDDMSNYLLIYLEKYDAILKQENSSFSLIKDIVKSCTGRSLRFKLNSYVKHGGTVVLDDNTGKVIISHPDYTYMMDAIASIEKKGKFINYYCESWKEGCHEARHLVIKSILSLCRDFNITNIFAGDPLFSSMFFLVDRNIGPKVGNVKLTDEYAHFAGKIKINGRIVM